MAPHRHLVVDVTVTSARTNTNVSRIGACLPFSGSLALRDQHGKIDADLCIYALLGTPSVHQMIHDYYPLSLEDGSRLAPIAANLVDRLAILVAVCRFPSMGTSESHFLRFDRYVRMQHFVCHTNFPFRRL
jgi:hypothetical protein